MSDKPNLNQDDETADESDKNTDYIKPENRTEDHKNSLLIAINEIAKVSLDILFDKKGKS